MRLFKLIPNLLFALIAMLATTSLKAQEIKSPATKELFNEIVHMDSILFNAYNTQNLEKFKSLFTEDLEWYQDNAGLVPLKTIFENVESNFKKEFKLTRKLVVGSLEVYPVKDYGAIEVGAHRFRHMENGKEEIATFKFVMIWKRIDNSWKVSRVISYDH